ncbi:MAG: hypothetical protein HCAMLNBO_02284 [Candidatus Brocadia fulgida]|nr:hypothetical protein [Candidatus Brocadia fulgida]
MACSECISEEPSGFASLLLHNRFTPYKDIFFHIHFIETLYEIFLRIVLIIFEV